MWSPGVPQPKVSSRSLTGLGLLPHHFEGLIKQRPHPARPSRGCSGHRVVTASLFPLTLWKKSSGHQAELNHGETSSLETVKGRSGLRGEEQNWEEQAETQSHCCLPPEES